ALIINNVKTAIRFKQDDELIAVRLTDGDDDILIGTAHGSLIRFNESALRPLGRTAAGVKGITLREGDKVVGLDVTKAETDDEVLVVTENGYGKRTPVSEYRLYNRSGKGIKTATITEHKSQEGCITSVEGKEDLMIVTNAGVIIRIGVEDISQNGRAAQGVRLIKLNDDQFVSTVAKVDEEEKEAEEIELQEADNEQIEGATSDNQQSESVVSDELSEGIVHTEVEEDSDEDGRQEVRKDFMDRINEDIDNSDNEETENEDDE